MTESAWAWAWAAKASFVALRILLLSGAAIILIVAFTALQIYLARNVLAGASYSPEYFAPLQSTAANFTTHLTANWKAISGWYLFLLGVSTSVCELYAKQAHIAYEKMLRRRHLRSIRSVVIFTCVGAIVIGLLFFFVVFGRDRAAAFVFADANKHLLLNGQFWDYFVNSVGFVTRYKLTEIAHVVLPVVFLFVLVTAAQVIWAFGSYGVLRFLAYLNQPVARVLRLRGGTAPLVSICISVAGAAIGMV